MYKMIVSDFDGTLVDFEDCVPTSTIVLIDQLRRAGYKFVIATGRCLKSVSYYNGDYPFIDYIASCNGAYIYDAIKKKEVYKKNILISNAKKIIKQYIKNNIVYVIDDCMWHLLSEKSAYEEEFDTIREEDYPKFLDNNKNNIYKIEIYFKSLRSAKEAIKDITNMNLKVSINLQLSKDYSMIEITYQNINKLEGVKKIAKLEKISLDEVISFGDGYNDIELLKASGLAIAPNSAVKEVKKIADSITSDCNNKGVESYLRENRDTLIPRQ